MLPAEVIEKLERKLLDPGARSSLEVADALLAEDFREIGKSGRSYDRAACLVALSQRAADLTYHIGDFALRELSPDVVLVTYVLTVTAPQAGASVRSSIWMREADGRWRMVFHQGTGAVSTQVSE
jgi:hypothetical protein